MKLRPCFLPFLFLCAVVTAQTSPQLVLPQSDMGIIYNQEFSLGLRMHTHGFAIGANIGKIKTYYKTNYLYFEIGELKHNKEVRQSFEIPSAISGRISKAFKYGKQNSLYVLRGAVGSKRYLTEKAKVKGVAVGYSYEGGLTMGLLKPYYLELRTGDGRGTIQTKYSEETEERFLDIWRIHGAAPWTKGFNELGLAPGVHAKFAVHFDWGAFDEYVKTIEGGIMIDAFLNKTPVMVELDNVENQRLYINLFINLQFGKRW